MFYKRKNISYDSKLEEPQVLGVLYSNNEEKLILPYIYEFAYFN